MVRRRPKAATLLSEGAVDACWTQESGHVAGPAPLPLLLLVGPFTTTAATVAQGRRPRSTSMVLFVDARPPAPGRQAGTDKGDIMGLPGFLTSVPRSREKGLSLYSLRPNNLIART